VLTALGRSDKFYYIPEAVGATIACLPPGRDQGRSETIISNTKASNADFSVNGLGIRPCHALRVASAARRRSFFIIHRREPRHDLAFEQRERAHFLRMHERAESQHQHEIILPDALGLGGENAPDRVGASDHQGARGLRLVAVGRDRDRRERAALDSQPGEAVEPALIGRPRGALGLGVGVGDEESRASRRNGASRPAVRPHRSSSARGRSLHVHDLLARPERHPCIPWLAANTGP